MTRVLVTPYLLNGVEGRCREILLKAGFEVVYPPAGLSLMDEATLAAHLDGVTGVLAGAEPFTRRVLTGSRIRAIARMGVGYDAIDMDAAGDLGIAVTIVPGTNHDSVAETTLALIFALNRAVCERDREVRGGVWKRTPLRRLAGQTLGIVGLGRIGQALAPRAAALGLKLLAYDPYPNAAFVAAHGVRCVSLDELLANADIVSLHLPCTAETEDLINARTLAKMKRGAVLINTGRGGLVDEDALADALRSGHLGGAGLDVFKIEPLPLDSPLLRLDNVVLSPHLGGLDNASVEAMANLAAQCLADLHAGLWPEECVVNPDVRPGWTWPPAPRQ